MARAGRPRSSASSGGWKLWPCHGAGRPQAVHAGQRGTRPGQGGNILSRTTLSLFYATDFADQIENSILPALKAGFMVLADRYIYTLMARDLVRGMDEDWLRNLYGIAIVPDAVFYLNVSPKELVQRNFAKDYASIIGKAAWTSGCPATCSTASSSIRR